ncbi:hypothetical protein [Streptomyces chartreusis]|uniref:Uncharacterized protein n=1 Tax=Streptomyces chartreusis TaxID=1969 RepID=A0A7H8TEZ7_STRCX|nr:hypothetical protein [Streptomyces chartreusis]QKZ22071.1 hypothetical protein HUT05_34815 [Streptomyces chartreusis]
MITFDHDTSKAQAAVDVARRRNMPVSGETTDCLAMWQVVMDACHMQTAERPTRDDVPASAEELRALIEQRAHEHRIAAAHREVAGDWREPIARRFNALVAKQVDGWVRSLQPDFLALVKVLVRQEKKLPEELDARRIDLRNPAVSAPWETASGAAVKLDQLVADRQILSRAAGRDLGQEAELWAVAKLAKNPDNADVFAHRLRDDVGPAIREWKELRHTPIARWLALARTPHLELELAVPGEVEERRQTMRRWHEAIQVVMTSGISRKAAEQAVTAALRG